MSEHANDMDEQNGRNLPERKKKFRLTYTDDDSPEEDAGRWE